MFVVFWSAYFKKFMNIFERSFAIFTSRIMHLVCPHKILNFCITPVNVFFFSWNDCNTQKKLKTKVMQNFEVQTRYSILWELTNSEWQHTPFSIYWNSYLAPRRGGIKQKNSLLSLKMISFVLFPQAWCSQVWMLIYWNWSICYWAKRLVYRIMPNFQGLLVLLTKCTEGRYYFCALSPAYHHVCYRLSTVISG